MSTIGKTPEHGTGPANPPGHANPLAKLFTGLLIEDFKRVRRNVYVLQAVAFTAVIIFSWWNEIGDLPHLIFPGTRPSAANYPEAAMETFWILFLLVIMMVITKVLFSQIRYLEGFLPVCAACKNIRTEEGWIPLESYLQKRSAIKLTHSMCASCARELYGYDEATGRFIDEGEAQ